jgi:hypothetical protein
VVSAHPLVLLETAEVEDREHGRRAPGSDRSFEIGEHRAAIPEAG